MGAAVRLHHEAAGSTQKLIPSFHHEAIHEHRASGMSRKWTMPFGRGALYSCKQLHKHSTLCSVCQGSAVHIHTSCGSCMIRIKCYMGEPQEKKNSFLYHLQSKDIPLITALHLTLLSSLFYYQNWFSPPQTSWVEEGYNSSIRFLKTPPW